MCAHTTSGGEEELRDGGTGKRASLATDRRTSRDHTRMLRYKLTLLAGRRCRIGCGGPRETRVNLVHAHGGGRLDQIGGGVTNALTDLTSEIHRLRHDGGLVEADEATENM